MRSLRVALGLALACSCVAVLVAGCGDDEGATFTPRGPGAAPSSGSDAAPEAPGASAPDAAPGDPERAFLHVDAWSVWWNDRTRCGAERTFHEICTRRATEDCAPFKSAWDACNVNEIV